MHKDEKRHRATANSTKLDAVVHTPRDVHVAQGEHRSMQSHPHDNNPAGDAGDRHKSVDSHW